MTTVPAIQNLTIYQGANFHEEFEWKTQAEPTSEPVLVNLNGFTARMQVRESAEAFNWILELTTENGRIVLNPEKALITLRLSATSTGALNFERGVYDLELESSTGFVTRLMQGTITINKEVTR